MDLVAGELDLVFVKFVTGFWLIGWQQDVAEACVGTNKAVEKQERGFTEADEAGFGPASGVRPGTDGSDPGSFCSLFFFFRPDSGLCYKRLLYCSILCEILSFRITILNLLIDLVSGR